MQIRLIHGDSFERLKEIPTASVGAIVVDPPYGLKFMNKDFDNLGEGEAQRMWHEKWLVEALRVLKVGGKIKAFGGTRTYHHLATAMENVGFDSITLEAWGYGSGFPKSLNIGKALKNEEEYSGLGTALKPAWEPFVVGVKGNADLRV